MFQPLSDREFIHIRAALVKRIKRDLFGKLPWGNGDSLFSTQHVLMFIPDLSWHVLCKVSITRMMDAYCIILHCMSVPTTCIFQIEPAVFLQYLAMAHGWDKFLKELQGLHDFVESQKAVCDKSQVHSMLEAHAKQITSRSLTCSADEARTFTSMVSKGPWTDEQKASLGSWAAEQLLNSSPGGKTKRRETQCITTFAHYFSVKDCEVLADQEASLSCKLECSWTASIVAS